ncbi:MAG TPA: HPF/RaiA family ribosome-associated protein [Vicinamibacteria bacterium]|nr:HPF/RaiA family ribosome-associated protein [Vicinamibacteria bacterium]
MEIAVHHAAARNAADLRAYLEYRMFAAVSRFSGSCARLDVHLSEREASKGPFVCTVALEIKPSGRVRIRATGKRPYVAIERAAERLSRGVTRHLGGLDHARAVGRGRVMAEKKGGSI